MILHFAVSPCYCPDKSFVRESQEIINSKLKTFKFIAKHPVHSRYFQGCTAHYVTCKYYRPLVHRCTFEFGKQLVFDAYKGCVDPEWCNRADAPYVPKDFCRYHKPGNAIGVEYCIDARQRKPLRRRCSTVA